MRFQRILLLFNFGDIWNGTSADQLLTIRNASTSNANLRGTVGSLPAPFSIISGGGSFDLPPGSSRTVQIRYSPQQIGSSSATLSITHNATNTSSPIYVSVRGNSCDSQLIVTNVNMNQSIFRLIFNADVNRQQSQAIYVINLGSSRCTLGVEPSIVGTDSSSFSFQPQASFQLPYNQPYRITVTFQPRRAGTHNAQLVFRYRLSGAPSDRTVTVNLVGQARGDSNPGQTNCSNPRNFGAYIDGKLLELIDTYAAQYYRPEWAGRNNDGVTLEKYKAWIAVIAWAEAGLGGYGAHSQGAPGSDVFVHSAQPETGFCIRTSQCECSSYRNKFKFSTGLGYFQLDNSGLSPSCSDRPTAGNNWSWWSTIAKLYPPCAVVSVLDWHYQTFGAQRYTLGDFWSIASRTWYALRNVSQHWLNVTGTFWNNGAPGQVDWAQIYSCLSQRASTRFPHLAYDKNICDIGMQNWSIDVNTDRGRVNITGSHRTWLITARNYCDAIIQRYFYTYIYSQDMKVEAWVLARKFNNYWKPTGYFFTRHYDMDQYPDTIQGRYGGTLPDRDGDGNPDPAIINYSGTPEEDCRTFDRISPPEGDVNFDGCVDDLDLLAILFAFGQEGTDLPEDVNGDGTVDDADLTIVIMNFGTGCEE